MVPKRQLDLNANSIFREHSAAQQGQAWKNELMS